MYLQISIKKHMPKTDDFLKTMPSPGMLESYEELMPGMTKKMVSMLAQEQENRHIQENKRIENAVYMLKIMSFILFIFLIALLTTSLVILFKTNSVSNFLLSSIVNFCFLIVISYINFRIMRIFTAPYNKMNNEEIEKARISTENINQKNTNNKQKNRVYQRTNRNNKNSGAFSRLNIKY